MNTIFELCAPRDEVLQGSLSEDIFAARLKDVMERRGDPVYFDARLFFENTYPTSGLKTLLGDSLGRLVGNASGKNAIIRLETAFGGGKTHNLIALYHAASGHAPADLLGRFIQPDTSLPQPGQVKIAAVVGSDQGPTNGMEHPDDGVKTYTLWGELAYQLGGRAGLSLVAESEKLRSAPGTSFLETLVGDKPTLIMLDEIARQLRAELAVPTATGKTTQADQTVAFLMSLLEFASSKERCLVVLTLASQSDAFVNETEQLRKNLAEAGNVSARQERVLTPTNEGEVYSIVTHRLFKTVDRARAGEVFDAYANYYREMVEKNADLPQRCLRAEYFQEMEKAYPFHPELLTTLSLKTATIPNFNQTRGALRLLAWTIRSLWNERPAGVYAIQHHHINLGDPQVAEDLTSRLDRPKFKQVIEADIVSSALGTPAHAQEVDKPLRAAGKPGYAERLAASIFLHSLTQGVAAGVDPADLMLSTLEPGDDPAVVTRALERLTDQAWFLEYDGRRYRFSTEPSINKIISDETSQVGISKAKAELEGRIRQIWKKGFLQPIAFPAQPGDVDDDAGLPKLAIMHFDAVKARAGETAPPELVRWVFEYSGIQESFRKFQNNLLFLVADEDQTENMVRVAQRYLAIGRITGDADRMAVFTKEQKDKLKGARDAAELDVRVAITKAYRYLYYPSGDAPKADGFLRRESLPAQEQGDVDKDQANVVLRVLRALSKVVTADDEPLQALYVKSKAWDMNQESMSTEDLRKAFARKIALRMILDVGQLKKTIQNGWKTGVWLYYDAGDEFAYDKDSPQPAFKITDEAILYTPAEAARLNLRIKGKWQPTPTGASVSGGGTVSEPLCPECGKPESQCECGISVENVIPSKFNGDGAPAQAFQRVADQCQEYHIQRLARLYIRIEGLGRQMASGARSLGLAIPQFGKGKFGVELDVKATYGQGDLRESFEQRFSGGWERYKRLKGVLEPFLQEADELKLTMRVACQFENGLDVSSPQFETIRDVLATLELGRIVVEAVPVIGE